MLSLRARILTGAVFWSFGLSFVGILIMGAILQMRPGYPRFVHATASANAHAVIALAVVCLFLGVWQVRKGFAPLAALRTRLGAVRAGRDRRVDGRYPGEVQPLVDELNALLDDRERRVSRALARAGDLAHGLKTPLAVLAHEADRPDATEGHFAAIVAQQVARMQRQIDRHLAHARAAASGAMPGARADVATATDGLVRTMHRLHAERGVVINVQIPAGLAVRAQPEDLEEMLGNLLDNACKWARSRVDVASEADAGRVRLTVEDDGAGLDPGLWDGVLQRGVRADEAAPGTGLGLAITRELAEVYGGNVTLGRSSSGGVRATLVLPAA